MFLGTKFEKNVIDKKKTAKKYLHDHIKNLVNIVLIQFITINKNSVAGISGFCISSNIGCLISNIIFGNNLAKQEFDKGFYLPNTNPIISCE